MSETLSASFEGAFAQLPAIVPLHLPLSAGGSMRCDVLRLDQVHPFVSGNKWYKLKHHLSAARKAGKNELLSFGGAFSNHLHALAYAGHRCGFATRALVRGEPVGELSPTLQDCKAWGMQIEWVSRQRYPEISISEARAQIAEQYGNAWVIPEGGGGSDGVAGVKELFLSLTNAAPFSYDYIVCPVGSGTTLAGIVSANVPGVKCIGVSALKANYELEQRVLQMLPPSGAHSVWQICHDYHFGGFAKLNARLRDFISMVHAETGLLLDPVYTGKMFFGIAEWCHQGRLSADAKVLMVHTGGLQGWRGFGSSGPGSWDDK